MLWAVGQAVAWLANARREAVGIDGSWWPFGAAQWSPPLGWTPWVVLAGLGIALALAGYLSSASRSRSMAPSSASAASRRRRRPAPTATAAARAAATPPRPCTAAGTARTSATNDGR